MTSVPIYLITNRKLVDEEKYFNTIMIASKYKNVSIILREKDLDDDKYENLYYKIKSVSPKTKIIINSKINVFKEVKEDIIQLSFKDFVKLKNFKGKAGVSVHSVEEGIMAAEKGAYYLLASHIFETKCKEGLKPKGIEFIRELRKKVDCEIIALGGINTSNFKEVIEAGADGIAIMSLLFNSNDIDNDILKFKR